MKRLRLSLAGASFDAVLLEREAPRTCQALVELLPFAGELWHSHFIGPALTSPLTLGPLAPENPYSLSIPAGSILVDIRQQPVVFEGKILPRELVVVYGTGARMLNWSGFSPANLVGKIDGDLTRLAEVGHRVQYGGVSTVQVTLS
jgi:uncharacterized protein DUF3830